MHIAYDFAASIEQRMQELKTVIILGHNEENYGYFWAGGFGKLDRSRFRNPLYSTTIVRPDGNVPILCFTWPAGET